MFLFPNSKAALAVWMGLCFVTGNLALAQDAPEQNTAPILQSLSATPQSTDPPALPDGSTDYATTTDTPRSTIILRGSLSKTDNMPIDMSEVLRLVSEQNLAIDQQYFGAKIQKNNFYRTMSNALPDVNWTYLQSHFSGGFQIFGNEVLNFTQTRINPQLQVLSTIYPGGRSIFESVASHRRYKSQKYLLETTQQEQMILAAQEYYQFLQTAVQRENALQSMEEANTQVKLNEARLRVGVGTRLELMQSQAFRAQQERALIDAENALAQAEQALITRLNLDPQTHLVAPLLVNQKKTLVASAQNLDLLMAQAIKNHPTIRRYDFELKALRSDFAARVSDIIPSVNIDFYTGYAGPNWDALVRNKSTGVRLQTALTENSGFALPLDLRNINLQLKQMKAQRDQSVRQVQSNITNAQLDSAAFEKAIEAAERELIASQQAYQLSTGRYKVGLGIFLDVLNAQTSLSNARAKLASTVLNYNQSQLSLLQALGEARQDTILNGLPPTQKGKR